RAQYTSSGRSPATRCAHPMTVEMPRVRLLAPTSTTRCGTSGGGADAVRLPSAGFRAGRFIAPHRTHQAAVRFTTSARRVRVRSDPPDQCIDHGEGLIVDCVTAAPQVKD